MTEIEAALRDCTISYLSLENDQLKGELTEIKEELKEVKEKLNVDLSKIMKALHVN
jgi:hypothetical protein